jgi:hypothetical protein
MNGEFLFMENQVIDLRSQMEAEYLVKGKIEKHTAELQEQARLLEQELERRREMFSQERQ